MVVLRYCSGGCNRSVNALDWGEGGLLAFGVQNLVAVYHVEEQRVVATLTGHRGRVGCVRWLPTSAYLREGVTCAVELHVIVSGSADNDVLVWILFPGVCGEPWRVAARLPGHSGPVTSLAHAPLLAGGFLLASTSGDGSVRVWECLCARRPGAEGPAPQDAPSTNAVAALAQESWQLRQELAIPNQIQHAIAFARLPHQPDQLLMALGGVDASIRLYSYSGSRFQPACRLTGHSDWIRGLAFSAPHGDRLLLASASQDRSIRVWRLQPKHSGESKAPDATLASAPVAALGQGLTRYAPQPSFAVGGAMYVAVLEAVLMGHEDWVHSVAWQPAPPAPPLRGAMAGLLGQLGGANEETGSARPPPPLCLLSASMDRTMCLWRPDAATGVWMCEESAGEAGAASLGYYGAVFGADGATIAAHGYTGALHVWRRAGGRLRGRLEPVPATGGHVGAVVDAAWGGDGACLFTASVDQTVRVTACVRGRWCEMARPQVHGHNFACLACLAARRDRRMLYASGSEEKVVRVLEAPQAFLAQLAAARGEAPPLAVAAGPSPGAALALGATISALGLSNKAVYGDEGSGALGRGARGDSYAEGPDLAPHPAPAAVEGPPLEEHLAQNTLWPEIVKLYGHAAEVVCLAADPRGELLASACKAQAAQFAAVWLWDAMTWAPRGAPLAAHALTVTALAFSPDGERLLSASRDRSFALFQRTPPGAPRARLMTGEATSAGGEAAFVLMGRCERAHSRVLWGASWAPDSTTFVTGSRDGSVKMWSATVGAADSKGVPTKPLATLPAFPAAVTALAFAPKARPPRPGGPFAPAPERAGLQAQGLTPPGGVGGQGSLTASTFWLAVGLESGALEIWALEVAAAKPDCGSGPVSAGAHPLWRASPYVAHGGAVRRLAWRSAQQGPKAGPTQRGAPSSEGPAEPPAALPKPAPPAPLFQLASCGDDHCVRIFDVTLQHAV